MEIRVLGPLEVADNGRILALGSGRQLALVGLLLLNRNEVVSTEQLVDRLWEQPPPSASKIIRNYVSLLRKELGDRLVTQSPGYLIRVEPGELDAELLERAVESGRLEELNAALVLWRGRPFAQLAYEDFAQREIARLEELHLTAIEGRIEAELELGRAGALVAELEALVREHPLRERLRGQLMLALYRSGRQGEALAAYQDARRTLDAELGLEPGRQLQELERKILNQDEELEAPARATGRVPRGSRRLFALGAAALLGTGIAAAVVTVTGGGTSRGLSRLAANTVGEIDPKSNRIVAQIPAGASPTRLALAGSSLWVLNSEDQTVSRIDARKRVVLRTIPVPNYPSGLAADDRATWVVYVLPGGESQGSAAAAVIDARFNDVTQTVELNRSFGGSDGIALAASSAWVADPGFVTRIDEESGKVQALIPVGLAGETDVIFDGAAIWAIGGSGIVRIDPATNEVAATIPVAQGLPSGPSPTALSVGSGAVWVANRLLGGRGQSFGSGKRGTVSRIDPATNAVVATITVGHEPFAIAADDTAVWVANRTDFTISKIDPRTNRVTDTIRIGNRPQGLAVGDGAVWVSVA